MISVEIDPGSLAKLKAKLSAELYQEAIAAALTDAAHAAEGEVKGRTPVVTGTLRRSVQSDVASAGRFPNPEARVATKSEYAWWIETGETTGGRKLRTRPGGYRMFEEGARATEGRIPAILEAIVAAIEKRWAA